LKNQSLEKEVDLHIEELLDNWSGMTNAQLLDVQLKRVMQELDEAIALHLRRVVFIHGIGNGRLKQEVRRVIATYKNVRFHDASFQRYGFGATEVELL
jgi:dsDNA-specific endonuclease/ATPase MutS2